MKRLTSILFFLPFTACTLNQVKDYDNVISRENNTKAINSFDIAKKASSITPQNSTKKAIQENLNSESRVIIRAIEITWIQVSDNSGNLLLSKVLQPNEAYNVPNKQDLELLTSNIDGLKIFVDGKPIPPIATDELTLSTEISLNPESLLSKQKL